MYYAKSTNDSDTHGEVGPGQAALYKLYMNDAMMICIV